ncbi:zinc finger protein 236-like [Ischnura elegans]|uniref:zinc finger protein 236-like n=1 Tax=Ischnura elegans TaxID=197161 RepID=UPI001ED879CB|nr:zinc finger protein 236-like [Ischnura elegans]
MDNPERSGELMTNVQLVSHLDEEVKIVHDGVKGGRDEVSLISSDDVGTQYMTIQSEQTISKEPQEHLGDCDSQSDTLTASTLSGNGGQGEEMLAHVVQMPSGQHALVVDIMEAVPADGSKNQTHSSSQLKEGAYYTTVPTSGTSVGNRVTLLSPVSTGNSDHHHIQHHSVHHSTESLPVVSRAYIPDTDGMVVATSGHYSETAATSVVEDIMLPHLTEEDRRLAAALVQLVQQQKHQQQHQPTQQHLPVCVSDATNVIMNTAEIQGLIGVGKGLHPEDTHVVVTTDKPVSSTMVVDYIQAVEDGSVVSSSHDKADELVVSSPRIRTRDVDGPYGQPHQDDNSYAKLHVILPHPKKAIMGQGAAVRNRLKRFRTEIEESSVVHMLDTNSPVVDGVQYVTVSNLGTTLKNEHGEVMEMMEVGEEADELGEGIVEEGEEEEILEELEDEDEMEEVCTREELEALDYETGTSEGILGPSDRSLPHKKRIPPKLKGNTLVMDSEEKKKLSQVHVKCYKCEICGEGLASQGDYEAHKEQMHPQDQSVDGVKKNPFTCLLCGQAFPSQYKFFEHLKCHYEPLLENERSQRKVKEEDTEVKHEEEPLAQVETVEMTLVDESQHVVSRAQEEMPQKEIHIIHHQDQPPGVELPAFLCTHCNKTFRRQKAYETHMNLVHGPDEEEEEEEHHQQQPHHTITTHGTVLEETVVVTTKKDQQQTEWIPTFFAEEDDEEDEEDDEEWGDSDVLDRPARRRQHNPGSGGAGDGVNDASTDGQGIGVHQHVCEACGGAFQSRAQLNHHIQEEHPESAHSGNQRKKARKGGGSGSGGGGGGSVRKIEHMTCPTCGRVFNHRNSLVYHMRSHTGERPHQCEVCGKSFFAASALKVHMRLHSGDKPYKCEYCGRHFRQWGDLKYHCISIHSDEKQYQCEYCGKDFARKYSLIVHRRIHTGEKNYKCDFCEKSFRASSYLQNHRRIHTGEKPHPCEVCGKPFRVRSDMKRHMQTHNRETTVTTVTTITTDPLASNGSQTLASDGDPSPPSDSQDHQVHHSSLTGSPQHHTMDPSGTLLGTELVVTTDTSKTEQITEEEAESILPDDGLENHQVVTSAATSAQHTVSQHVSAQPIDLNLVPGRAGVSIQQGHLSASVTEQVVQEVLHYARDPLEQRDNANTLYVWPIYMS